MDRHAPLVDACVDFAASVSPGAVAGVIAQLDGGDVDRATALLSGDAARSFTALVRAWQSSRSAATPERVADILRGAVAATTSARLHQRVELVWSGPDAPSSTLRSTAPALLELIGNARESVYLVTFAAYRVPEVADALGDAVARGVRVVFVLESSEAGKGGKVDFDPLPHLTTGAPGSMEVYAWPASQRPRDAQGRHGTLHAKFAVADRRQLLVSSANLTEFAFTLNIELGVLLTGGTGPAEVAGQVDQMIRLGVFQRVAGGE